MLTAHLREEVIIVVIVDSVTKETASNVRVSWATENIIITLY